MAAPATLSFANMMNLVLTASEIGLLWLTSNAAWKLYQLWPRPAIPLGPPIQPLHVPFLPLLPPGRHHPLEPLVPVGCQKPGPNTISTTCAEACRIYNGHPIGHMSSNGVYLFQATCAKNVDGVECPVEWNVTKNTNGSHESCSWILRGPTGEGTVRLLSTAGRTSEE